GSEPWSAVGEITGSLLCAISRDTARVRCPIPLPIHQRIANPRFKKVGHALPAPDLVSQHGRRTLTRGSTHFAHPYADPFAHAARVSLESAVVPIGVTSWVVESGLAVKAVEIITDELAVFHANAGIVDEVGHAA